jgi:aerobic C4-dicarboxylate transport protein
MAIAMVLGTMVGAFFPTLAVTLNPLAIIFIRLIRMVVPLIVFSTLTAGIAHIGNAREAGRIGLRSIVYFEVITTLALLFGLATADIDEALLAFAMATSEVALPRLIAKLEKAGCAPGVVGFVVPTGYSFNLDGSSIYLTLALMFIAQATGVHLSLYQQLGLLGVLLVVSKGIANVPSASLVVLASALSMIPQIPAAGIALILGVDRFMDSMRTATNFIGNGVAAMAIAKWENERDDRQMHLAFNQASPTPAAASIRSSLRESDDEKAMTA